jgi:type IV secretion system protein VirB4
MPLVISLIGLGLLAAVAPKLALMLAAVAAGGVGAELFRRHLREDRTEVRGVADVLPYGFLVADGTLLNKDATLSRGILFRSQQDADSATDEEKNATSEYIANAVAKLGEGWGIHATEVREESQEYPAGGAFGDVVSRVVDQERRASYEAKGKHYESRYFMVLTYSPPGQKYDKMLAFFEEGAAGGDTNWNAILDRFHDEFSEFVDRLRGRLHVETLNSAALLRHLHGCLTGLNHPVRVPEDGAYINVHLADQELVGGFEPRIGTKHIRVVAVQDYPWKSEPAVMASLGKLPFAFRWTSRLVLLSAQDAAREIKNARRGWRVDAGLKALLGGSRRTSDSDQNQGGAPRISMEADADDALAVAESGEGRFLYYTNCIVLHEDDPARADANARELLRILNDLGFTGRVETVNAVDAFWGSLPGLFYPNLRRPVIHTRNLGDLFPSCAQWAGLEHNPSPFLPEGSPPLMIVETAGSTPHRLNTDYYDNGNALVLGPPGAGKSAFLGLHRLQVLRYHGAQTVVFDVGYSAWLPAVATGAVHYDIGGRECALQPLARVHDAREALWAREWLVGLVKQQGHVCGAPDRVKLDRAIALLSAQPVRNRTLTELQVQVQDDRLRAALQPYIGTFLDGETDTVADAPHLVFEVGGLMKMGPAMRTPTILYLMHRTELMTEAGQFPTWTYLDELHRYLDDPDFEHFIGKMLATERKNNSRYILATQSLSQLESSPIRDVVFEFCPTKILLPNPEAATTTRKLYVAIGLNEAEIAQIANGVPKRDYFFRNPEGKRVFGLGIGRIAAAVLFPRRGETVPQTRQAVLAMMEEHGPGWTREWLRQAGVRASADALMDLVTRKEDTQRRAA